MRQWMNPQQAATASGSSSTATGRMPFGECPSCGVPLIRIRSKKLESYNQIFVKCPNNIKGDPRTCGYIRSEMEYEMDMMKKYNLDEPRTHEHELNLNQQVGEMKQELSQMKSQIDKALGEIWELKKQKSVDMNAVVMALAVGLVLGMLVTVMLK